MASLKTLVKNTKLCHVHKVVLERVLQKVSDEIIACTGTLTLTQLQTSCVRGLFSTELMC